MPDETSEKTAQKKNGVVAAVAQQTAQAQPTQAANTQQTAQQPIQAAQAQGAQTTQNAQGAQAQDAPFKRRELHWAVAHVYSSKNNTVITVTDVSGAETIAKASGGVMVKADREKGKPYAAIRATSKVVNECRNRGINALHIRIRAPGGHGAKTPGAGAQAVVRSMARMGIKIGRIEDVTPIPSDTTKRPWGRRGRRV